MDRGEIRPRSIRQASPEASGNGRRNPVGYKPNWLFMVYMVAGDSDKLDSLAIQDLVEMERGVAKNPDVQVFVQVHRRWPANPQRYTIKAPTPDDPLQTNLVKEVTPSAEQALASTSTSTPTPPE